MIIKVSEIDDEVSLAGELDPETLSPWRSETEGFRVASPVRYDLTLRKESRSVVVLGSVECVVQMACSRCLDECAIPLSFGIDLELEPKESMPAVSELEIRGHEMDVDYFDNDEVDLVSIIGSEMLLNIPMMPLCRDDCRGLCDVCGINRNYESCLCDNRPATVLAEKLKSFLN